MSEDEPANAGGTQLTVSDLIRELTKLRDWTGYVLKELEELKASKRLEDNAVLTRQQSMTWIWQPLTRGCQQKILDLPLGEVPDAKP